MVEISDQKPSIFSYQLLYYLTNSLGTRKTNHRDSYINFLFARILMKNNVYFWCIVLWHQNSSNMKIFTFRSKRTEICYYLHPFDAFAFQPIQNKQSPIVCVMKKNSSTKYIQQQKLTEHEVNFKECLFAWSCSLIFDAIGCILVMETVMCLTLWQVWMKNFNQILCMEFYYYN